MSRQKTDTEIINHKTSAVNKLSSYLDELISSSDPMDKGRADKLSYWIEDYANFLKKEKTFDSCKVIRYKKGDIVKLHLGYRIGREEGGLHFAVVLDANNAKSSDTITVIPLTSMKPGKIPHRNSVVLGNELFRLVIGKHDKLARQIEIDSAACIERMNKLKECIEESRNQNNDMELKQYFSELDRQTTMITNLNKNLSACEEMRKSILKMKNGSVALVDQILTISKIRIYDPVYSANVLYGIRLSPSTMQLIDQKVAELFLGVSTQK